MYCIVIKKYNSFLNYTFMPPLPLLLFITYLQRQARHFQIFLLNKQKIHQIIKTPCNLMFTSYPYFQFQSSPN